MLKIDTKIRTDLEHPNSYSGISISGKNSGDSSSQWSAVRDGLSIQKWGNDWTVQVTSDSHNEDRCV